MIKKAIVPIAGLATRFLPLSKVVPKELWPLADIPSIQYIIREAKDSGIKEIIFVLRQDNKRVLEYLKPCRKTEKLLKERKKTDILEELKSLEGLCSGLEFSYVFQSKPLGDGHAILQAAKLIKDEPVINMFGDDIIDSQVPCTLQLANIFKTCQKPVIALRKLAADKIHSYGTVGVEKIASRLYKIKSIVEKPKKEEAPSDLAIVGRHILTPEVFHYLKKAKPSKKGEIILAEVINNQMLADGKVIYGYEFEGNWLECGDKLKWMKSDIYFSIHHPKYGSEIREYIKQIKL
jgi:UTP--glucose-1-phosphate uridylyltransferase